MRISDWSSDVCSSDLLQGDNIKKFFHEKNKGKGAAIQTGWTHANGEIILIQDADLEYDPVDYSNLLGPILGGKADVVFGSRFLGGGRSEERRVGKECVRTGRSRWSAEH